MKVLPLLLGLLVSACSPGAAPPESQDNARVGEGTATVDICRLAQDGSGFHGKMVRTRGIAVFGAHDIFVSSANCLHRDIGWSEAEGFERSADTTGLLGNGPQSTEAV
jgi:hypothetical protein